MSQTLGRLATAAAVASLAATALGAAQQAGAPPASTPDQRPPVFRGVANFVYVDAYPRQDGKLVEGLRAEDFQIFEEGKLQKIETFELIRSEPNTPDADRRDPNTKAESDRQAADPHNRLFVIYLNPYHTSFVGAHDAKVPLLDFLGRTIGPTDLFGVLRPDVPVNQLVFARRTETLEIELTKYFDWGKDGRMVMADNDLERRLLQCSAGVGETLVTLHREDLLATSLEHLMVHLRDLRDERKNVLLVSEGWVPQRDYPELLAQSTGAVPPIGTDPTGRLRIGPQSGLSSDTWCNQQIGRLASLNLEQRFRDLLTLAARSNVSFYPVDVGGLKTNMPDASMSSAAVAARGGAMGMMNYGRARTDTLRVLAENTDGLAIVDTNGLSQGFRRISDQLSAYYLLGYSSTNTNLDGRFHRIEVKVDRPKVSVSARRGYLAGTAAAVAASAASAATVVPGIVEELARVARLRPDTDVLAYGVASAASVNIVVEIASARMSQWTGGADVRVSLSGGSGTAAATGTIEPGARAAIVSVPIAGVGAGPWRASIVASRGTNQAEDRIEVRAADGPLLGTPVAFRGTALARIAVRPVADFQFRRTERIHVEWPILKALDQRTARLLDRRGQPLALETALTDREVNGTPALAADLTLASLGEGDYLIEVTAGSGAEQQRALLAFRVVR